MLPEFGYHEALFHAACTYLTRGWSVIPVYGDGDPERAKVAAVEWAAFQRRRCDSADAHRWFMERRCGGLAVVTGRISNLAVLDFDDLARFEAFQRDHPDLTETYTVQTRRGLHLYYQVPPGVKVESRKTSKVDLQFDGRCVVAPPTVIGDCRYRVINDITPKTVTEGDIRCLYSFLTAIHQENAPAPVFSASEGISDGAQRAAGDLVALYRHLTVKVGRNEALFRVSLRARDAGWLLEQVVECLADVHVLQPATGTHRPENPEQRRREALGTIESAFSRPPRPRRRQAGQIPNSVREALLQLRQTHTLRVLEGLQLRGVKPGQMFTYREAVQLLSGLVGQWSIRRALVATAPDGTPIFALNNPSPRPPTPATAESEMREPPSKRRLLINAPKPTSNRPGRSIQCYFAMPGAYELCEQLDVRPSGSDTLAEADVNSASGYRQALHREYIQRRPGQYPRSWLASRLGVSIRTEQRYNLAADIRVEARYDSVLVSWSNLNAIADFEVAGTFLQDERGKRYPAKQEIAAHLLAQRHTVIYKRQRINHYSCGASPPRLIPTPLLPNPQRPVGTKTPKQSGPLAVRGYHLFADKMVPAVLDPPVTVPPIPPIPAPSMPMLPQQQARSPAGTKHRSIRYYRSPLPDSRMEYLAQRVHIETASNAAGQGMSLCNARRLVDTYGVQSVEKMLNRMVWLRRKGKINNSAGFLVVASRIAWRSQNGATDLGTPAPRYVGEPSRRKGHSPPMALREVETSCGNE